VITDRILLYLGSYKKTRGDFLLILHDHYVSGHSIGMERLLSFGSNCAKNILFERLMGKAIFFSKISII
jgi:hypothetical protein